MANCLECGKELNYGGRTDRKYCSDSCRNRHNYKRNKDSLLYRERVLRHIEKNYEILSELLERGEKSKSLVDLAENGFNSFFFTTMKKVKTHNECRCYDIKYFLSENKIFGIERVRRKQKKEA